MTYCPTDLLSYCPTDLLLAVEAFVDEGHFHEIDGEVLVFGGQHGLFGPDEPYLPGRGMVEAGP